MVRSVDANQFNNKFNMKSQDLTRSTQAGKIKMGTTKKTTIDKGLVTGASTFGDYQKASATTGIKKTTTGTKTTPESTSKSGVVKDGQSKVTGGSKTGDAGGESKLSKLEKEPGHTSTSLTGTSSAKTSTTTKKPAPGTSQGGAGVKKTGGTKTGMTDTVEEQENEDGDGNDDHEDDRDKKNKGSPSDSMGINIYSMGMGTKGMFNQGKR